MNQSLRLERHAPLAMVLLLVVAAGFVATAAMTQSPHPLMAAAFPLLLGIWLWISRPHGCTLEFEGEQVSTDLDAKSVRYEDIAGLTVSGTTPEADKTPFPSGTLVIFESGGFVRFPQLSRRSAQQSYQMLLDRIPESGSREVTRELRARLQADLALFDDDLVLTYRNRGATKQPGSGFGGFALTLLATALVWGVVGSQQPALETWVAVSGILVGITVVFWLLSLLFATIRDSRLPERVESSMIVSPRGIALHQGPLKGELKWEEIRSIDCSGLPHGFLAFTAVPHGLCIRVDGAAIVVFDIYDRPLATIYQGIKRYWEAR